MREICLKLAIKSPENVNVFIVNSESISHIDLVFPLMNLNK